MRINHVKVEGHETLKRDMSSHAIIDNDDLAYTSYMQRRETEKRQRQEMNNLKKEVNELKDDIKEIKDLLINLIKGKQ